MRNKVLIKVSTIIMVLLLSGCGNKTANTDSTAEVANSVQVESDSKDPEETPTENPSNIEIDNDQNDNSITEVTTEDTAENFLSQDQAEADAEHEDNQIVQETVAKEVEEETKSIADCYYYNCHFNLWLPALGIEWLFMITAI